MLSDINLLILRMDWSSGFVGSQECEFEKLNKGVNHLTKNSTLNVPLIRPLGF